MSKDNEGQVSEVGRMDDPDAEISDSQSVAGNPEIDADEANAGPAGPNSNPNKGKGEKTPKGGPA